MQLDTFNYNSRKKFVSKVGRDLVVKYKTGELMGKYTLKRISPENLSILRRSKHSYSLLKDNDNFAVAEIPNDINLVNSIGIHQCNTCARQFERCAISSSGRKVRDSIEFGSCSKGIEEYDFISKGFETFGCRTNAYIVLSCNNYKAINPNRIQPKPQPQKKDAFQLYSIYKRDHPGASWNEFLSMQRGKK